MPQPVMPPPRIRPAVITLVFVATVLLSGLAIGWAVLPGAWYVWLTKPGFTPPNWVFPPAWSLLYILIGIAGARTWIRDRRGRGMRIWFGQMALNFLWSPAFFGAEAPVLGLFVILPLLALVLAFAADRWRRDRPAAWLFLPYAAWVAYACALNAAIWWLN